MVAVVSIRLVCIILYIASHSSFKECLSAKVNDSMIIRDSTSPDCLMSQQTGEHNTETFGTAFKGVGKNSENKSLKI